MYVNEMLYNFWGPRLVEDMDNLSWEEKSLEENQPKVNYDQNRIFFEEWFMDEMLSIYNAAQNGARYMQRVGYIKTKLCVLFDDYLHRMSMLTDRDYNSFRYSADNWVKSTKWSIDTLLTEYESMQDLSPRIRATEQGKKMMTTRMIVNNDVRGALNTFLSNMQQGSLSSLSYYRRMIPSPFYTEEGKDACSMSHAKNQPAPSASHAKSNGKSEPKTFDSYHRKGDLAKLKGYLHANMDGKTDVQAFRYIHVAIVERYIERPEVTVVREEFKVKGDKTTYNDYVGFSGSLTKMPKHQRTLAAIKEELHALLDE
ncbi:MAG: hypothetical protein KBS58_07610 [Bacteroidales bacterium]|nr:hypothetical protein [Candidatus Cacconaster equi]